MHANAKIDVNATLTPDDVWAVAVSGAYVAASSELAPLMDASEAFLARCIQERRRIYGVTTGYGPQARYDVDPAASHRLQRNLLYHLATGVGAPLSPAHTRAMMIARASNLARGYSAVSRAAFTLILECLNRGVLPVVPEMGTVGASGDLTPLAHLGLLLIGEGSASVDGVVMPGAAALERTGLHPIELGAKDGLAIVNGTAAMTGIAALNGAGAERAFHTALRLGALYAESLHAHAEAFDRRFGVARPHAGQQQAHAFLAELFAGSARLKPSVQPPPQLDDARGAVSSARVLPQDPYSIRCLPQIFGAAFDVLAFHNQVVTCELNAATDNPLVFADDEAVLHGGNFFGAHVGAASDALALAVVNVAVHAERAIARITDVELNGGLPAFLHAPPSGVNSGFMGAQVTASALVAEMRSLASPASIQSIPTNGNNQDVVPMGTIAARKTAKLLDLLWMLLAIEALILTRARELLATTQPSSGAFSPAADALVRWVRSHAPPFDEDRPLAHEIATVSAALAQADLRIGSSTL